MNGNVLKGGIFMNPTKEFRDYMISQGAALVGIGDLTTVPSSDYPVGIAVAIPLPKIFNLLQPENTTNCILL